ncbi:restriction endonuclease subunit S [Allobranchiibius sp. CTAmp26]|uniref:restriction endonuclease subunit S n=1 Tax=Allobranchiibius sp. CTAmp26 TaxID=2815214 RepID=UPI001AA0EA30|nr:restriction endonuclease subunit S [Allobranchiibius sp. CTAmp26]MBO1753730.1 restriction endonuclease subunit S [Allobranchiibius sp. CTAmp26]
MIGRHLAVEPLTATAPPTWAITRFKAALDRLEDRNADLSEPMMSLKSSGEIVARSSLGQRQEPDKKSLPRYLVTRPGDLVVNPMWLIGGAIGTSKVSGAVSPDYRVFRPRNHNPRYLHYLLRTCAYIDQYRLYTRAQTTFDRRVQQPDLDNLPLLTPPETEQRAIADFLDRETARIDTLIAKQEQLITRLGERRIGVIRASVAGLASGGAFDYDGHWFGTPPWTWTTAPVRYDFSVVLGKMLNASKSGNVPESDTARPYLAAGSIQPDQLVLDESKQMRFSRAELARYSLRAGDVVVVEGGAGYGRSHLLRNDLDGWGFQNHVARIRPSSGRVASEFLTYCLKACLATGYVEANNRTATMPSLSRDVLGAIRIPVPPIAEQHQISAYLDEQTAKIDTLIEKTERFIELSKERRSALITAAVIGQLDVRGEVT